jgi:predicted RNase H-like HicB family nuclease
MKVSVENREFTIIVEEEPEGRGFTGQCKELPTAISQGKTLEELEENIKDEVLFPQKIISKFIDS